jgi:hypothetical protein
MNLTPKPIPHPFRQERDHFIEEVNRRMLAQAVWGDLSEPFRERLIATMYLAGFGFDDALELCAQLSDQVVEAIRKLAGEAPKETCSHVLVELAGGAIFCRKCKRRF